MSAIHTARTLAREVADLQAKADKARKDRDVAIRYAILDPDVTLADISRATGLTRTMLYKILERSTR